MKQLIFSSLFAMIMFGLCPNNVKAQDDRIYNYVSLKNPPTYPGGMASFYKFISANIKYPEMAKKENVQGMVLISFVVKKDGSLSDLIVNRKVGAGLDEEALRVLKLSKRWNPGMVDGKPVNVKYNIPVKFALPGISPKAVAKVNTTPSSPVVEENIVYNYVSMENPPTYPGGMASFYKFISQEMQYPKMAIENKVQGTTLVSFTVEKDGSLSDIKVDRKLGSGTDEEAIRVLKLSKRWNPGMQNGQVVRVKYNVPIKFSMKI